MAKIFTIDSETFLPFGRRDFTFVSLFLLFQFFSPVAFYIFLFSSQAHTAYELFIFELLAFETFVSRG